MQEDVERDELIYLTIDELLARAEAGDQSASTGPACVISRAIAWTRAPARRSACAGLPPGWDTHRRRPSSATATRRIAVPKNLRHSPNGIDNRPARDMPRRSIPWAVSTSMAWESGKTFASRCRGWRKRRHRTMRMPWSCLAMFSRAARLWCRTMKRPVSITVSPPSWARRPASTCTVICSCSARDGKRSAGSVRLSRPLRGTGVRGRARNQGEVPGILSV